jgi:hypothetical protein
MYSGVLIIGACLIGVGISQIRRGQRRNGKALLVGGTLSCAIALIAILWRRSF